MTDYCDYSDYAPTDSYVSPDDEDYQAKEDLSKYEYEAGWLDFLHGVYMPGALHSKSAYRTGFEDCARSIVAGHQGGETPQK